MQPLPYIIILNVFSCYVVVTKKNMLKAKANRLKCLFFATASLLMLFTYYNFYQEDPVECDKPNLARVFCVILTQPSSLRTKAKAVHETWAKECDDHKFITVIPPRLSNVTFKIGESLETQQGMKLLQAAGFNSESYTKLTDKIYRSFIEIYKRYNNFDFYLKVDDDTFVFMDHLKQFLVSQKQCERKSYGYNFKYWFNVKAWQSGGAGYVLSQRSMLDLGAQLVKDYNYCPNTGFEDIDVAKCLKMLGTYPGRSRDTLGRERFHP
jgi:glycoprotein-N-acetylgalactosamine 3-beta-galactosyltransferase